MNERRFEISFVNVLLCLLVIFIHVSSEPVTVLDKMSWEYISVMVPWKLSAFVVQGFVFLSGMKLFLSDTDNLNYGKYYLSKIKNIVIPYVIWVGIYYFYFMRKGYFHFSISGLLENILLGNLVSHFYFIVVIVQFYALAPLWIKLFRKISPIIIVFVSLMITVIFGKYFVHMLNLIFDGYTFGYNDRVFTTYIFYWTAGCAAGKYFDGFKRLVTENRRSISVIFILLAVINAFCAYLNISGIKNIYWLEDLHTMYCVFAILFAFVLAYRFKTNKAIKAIDRVTFPIYLCHILIINIINEIMTDVGVASISGRYAVRIAAVYFISVGLCLIYGKIKEYIYKLKRA